MANPEKKSSYLAQLINWCLMNKVGIEVLPHIMHNNAIDMWLISFKREDRSHSMLVTERELSDPKFYDYLSQTVSIKLIAPPLKVK